MRYAFKKKENKKLKTKECNFNTSRDERFDCAAVYTQVEIEEIG